MAWREEQWLPVPGFRGLYEVSDRGNVRSLDRYVAGPADGGGRPGRRRRRGRPLQPWPDAGGVLRVSLCRDGCRAVRAVHRLVLEAFEGPCPPGMEASRRGGGQHDNSRGNLRWVPRTRRRGTSAPPIGGRGKLTTAGAAEIRRRVAAGERQQAVAADFGVAQQHVSRIAAGAQWAGAGAGR